MPRSYPRKVVLITAGPYRAFTVLARGPAFRGNKYTRPRLIAEVVAVHVYKCRAVHYDRNHGPCNCGAEQLYKEWRKATQ